MKEHYFGNTTINKIPPKNIFNKKNFPTLILLGLLFTFILPNLASVFAQDVTITYDPGPGGTYAGETSGGGIDGQSFTATKTGVIKSISVFGWMVGDATLNIYDGDGTSGTLLHTQTFPQQNAGMAMDGNRYIEISTTISSAVEITSGERYTFTLGPIETISIAYTDGNGYAGGVLYRDGAINDVTYDLAFKVVQGDPVLPVELISFAALPAGNSVKLNWATATEVNNYGFEVERASLGNTPGQDGLKWEKIGFVQGNGNSSSLKEYTYIDENPPAGNLQYRLKQIDTDGKYGYYETIAKVTFSLTGVNKNEYSKVFSLEQNYPNPFNPATVIRYSIPNSDRTIIKIYDVLGKEVKTLLDEYKDAGQYELKFNANELTSGIYFYKIISGTYSETKKMILLR